MGILLTAAVVLWILTRPVPLRWPAYLLPLAVFMAATLLSLAVSPNPGIGWRPVQKSVLFSMGVLSATFVTTESRRRAAYKLLLATASLAGIMAIAQFVLAESTFFRTGLRADDPTLVNRITGPLGHWLTFSGVQLLVWCAAISALAFLGRKWIVPFSIVGMAIILSNTRGAWLGAAAGFAFVGWALPRRILAMVLIPMIAICIAASPFIYRRISMSLDAGLATNYCRVAYFVVGTRMIKDHPFFGVGPERIHDEFPNYYTGTELDKCYHGHLHSNVLQIAAERGLLCLAAFLWCLVELYRSLLRLLKRSDENARWPILGSLAALTGFVVAGMTEFNFGDSEVLVLLLFLISIPFGLASHVQENPDSQPR